MVQAVLSFILQKLCQVVEMKKTNKLTKQRVYLQKYAIKILIVRKQPNQQRKTKMQCFLLIYDKNAVENT